MKDPSGSERDSKFTFISKVFIIAVAVTGLNILLSFRLSGRSNHPPPVASIMPPVISKPQIVLFGDSLTERSFNPAGGWAAALSDYYCRKADVLNRGFGGYTTRWALPMVRDIFPSRTPREAPILATIFFGANDAALKDTMGEVQHVPVDEYQKNLRLIVEGVRAAGVTRIILLTPPPVYEPGRLIHQQQIAVRDNRPDANTRDPDRTNKEAGKYAIAAKAVAADLGIPSVDLWSKMQAADEAWMTSFFIQDGLHFTGAGNLFVFDQVRQVIESEFSDVRPQELPNHMPMWFEVDPKDPEATFSTLKSGA